MSNPRTTAGEASRLGLASWCLYDWANSAFPTIVTTFVFSVYFTRAVADNPVDGAVQWSHSVTAAALAVVLGAPALGAIADGLGRRKPWLLAFTALTVAGTLALWLVEPSPSYVLAGQVLYAAAATLFRVRHGVLRRHAAQHRPARIYRPHVRLGLGPGLWRRPGVPCPCARLCSSTPTRRRSGLPASPTSTSVPPASSLRCGSACSRSPCSCSRLTAPRPASLSGTPCRRACAVCSPPCGSCWPIAPSPASCWPTCSTRTGSTPCLPSAASMPPGPSR